MTFQNKLGFHGWGAGGGTTIAISHEQSPQLLFFNSQELKHINTDVL